VVSADLAGQGSLAVPGLWLSKPHLHAGLAFVAVNIPISFFMNQIN
jgi:hypothetical protein